VFEGDMVRVKAGLFASFCGAVEEVDEARSGVKVVLAVFGRARIRPGRENLIAVDEREEPMVPAQNLRPWFLGGSFWNE
jgi:hypothetical protein